MSGSFVGSYVTEIAAALIASAVSGQHALLISAPGWGKTQIARRMAAQIAGEDRYVFTRLEASTPPEVVKGMPDPAAALASPPRIVPVVTGTPYDPNARIVILDELGRPNDVVFDILIDTLDRQDLPIDQAPTVWGTANWMPTSERTAALRDRITFWVWVIPGTVDAKAITDAHLNGIGSALELPTGKVPDWKEVELIRAARPGPQAADEVGAAIQLLAQEAAAQGLEVHPRRIFQWTNVLFRTGVYYGGSANFAKLPALAMAALKYCWPTATEEEWRNWNAIAGAVNDPVGAAIEAIAQAAYGKFEEIKKNKSGSAEMVMELGVALSDAQSSLERLGKDDDRISDTINELTVKFTKMIRESNKKGN